MAGDAAISIAQKVVERLVEPVVAAVIRQFSYVFFYKKNIKDLSDKVEHLESIRADVQRSAEALQRNSEDIGNLGHEWLRNVEKRKADADEVLKGSTDKVKEGCLNGWCPNVKHRYVLSRKATKQVVELDTLQQEALKGKYTQFAYTSEPVGTKFTSLPEVSSKFKSRISSMNEVMSALKDDEIRSIGICGMGGVGKTTMVEEVRGRARSMNLFDEVAMTTVSQNQDLFKIQGDLAEMLGLTSIKNDDNIIVRRDKLHERLTNGKRILVILDDVWKGFELQKVGIPIVGDTKGCKVIITSRNERLCAEMCIQKIVTVPTLTEPEAWHLFKEKMGNCLENEDLLDIAKKIAMECGGLPIAIVTLATALAHTEVYEWKEALQQLKKGSVTSIPEMGEKVYSSIRLSYDFLGTQLPQAQRILLLCSHWPEDSHIEVETLVRCTFGLRLFEDVQTVEGARNKIDTLVKRLTSCYLLQAVADKTVKVHDVVQDVCTHILRNETPSNVGSTWSSVTLDYSKYKLIQIEPNGSSYSVDFEGMGELRILEFAPQNGNQLRCVCKIPSFQFLTNIRVLCLEYNIFSGDLSSLGYLKGLEVLSFLESFLLEELPSDQICQLYRLKVLDLRCNRGLGSCILSGLNKLEELYIGEQHSWQCSSSSNEEESNCASIAELNSLSSLTTLKTRLSDTVNFKDLRVNLFDKLETFHITIKNERGSSYGPSRLHGKRLSLWKVNLSLLSDVKLLSLHRNTEHLCIEEMDLKNHFLKEFGKLKSLKIACCDKAEFLFDAADIAFATKMESLEVGKMNDLIEICRDGKLHAGSLVKLQKADLWSLPALRHLWRFPVRLPSLGNLRVLRLYDCHALRSLFSYSVAKCLVQLESISINWCCMLEEIISNDGGEEVIITKHRSKDNSKGTIPPLVNRQVTEEVIEIKVNDSSQTESMNTILEFPKLRVIKLDSLNTLTSFCPSDHKLVLPLLEKVSIKKCPNMNFFCRGQVSAPNVKNMKVDGGPVSIGDLNTI